MYITKKFLTRILAIPCVQEDLPQLALVLVVSAGCPFSLISIMSVTASAINILFALIKRLVECMLITTATESWTENGAFGDGDGHVDTLKTADTADLHGTEGVEMAESTNCLRCWCEACV